MPRIHVHSCPSLTSEELAALKALLEAAGFSLVEEKECKEDLQAESAELEPDNAGESADEEVLVVVLYPDCDVEGSLEEAAGRVGRGGGRVIGVWPREGAADQLPESLKKYGADTSPWDANELRRAICGNEKPLWKDTAGTPAPKRPMAANTKC